MQFITNTQHIPEPRKPREQEINRGNMKTETMEQNEYLESL